MSYERGLREREREREGARELSWLMNLQEGKTKATCAVSAGMSSFLLRYTILLRFFLSAHSPFSSRLVLFLPETINQILSGDGALTS